MTSSQPFGSSELSLTQRRRSKFTFKQLNQLGLSSTTCPLRVIALIDLDAFYAQCEMVRLGIPEDQPLAVQQWQGLIAINYPARKFGLNRHVTLAEAKKLCPELQAIHVATWKEGETTWAYHEDAFKNLATHKVSLDPYRKESRRILALIKDSLPAPPMQRVEKASVDEVFLDLSAQVHSILLERFPELRGPPPYDDPTEHLPRPPTTALDWAADALVDLDDSQTEDDDPDWDDMAMLIGSEIVRDLRQKVYAELKYTCSAGISRNKMLAKLGAGHNKPNAQTVIRNRAVQQFLSGFKFTKIRMLGGKLGDGVVSMFNVDTVEELLEVPLDQLKKLGDDTGQWLYDTIRGDDNSEVNARTQIKSMLSAKSFRPSINTIEQAKRWMRIFAADIFSRCVEEGVLKNKRKPKTINLHYKQATQSRSKQLPIPQGKTLSEDILYDLGCTLLAQIVASGRAWPCSNLSLSVGGFEDGVSGNRGIGSFLVHGEEAKALRPNDRPLEREDSADTNSTRPQKRRKVDAGGMVNFFKTREDSRSEIEQEDQDGSESGIVMEDTIEPPVEEEPVIRAPKKPFFQLPSSDNVTPPPDIPPPSGQGQGQPPSPLHQAVLEIFFCDRCKKAFPITTQSEHEDEHVARDLQDQFRREDRAAATTTITTPKPPETRPKSQQKRGRPPGALNKPKGPDKGQKKLAFG